MLYRISILKRDWQAWADDERPVLHFTSSGADEMPPDTTAVAPTSSRPRRRARAAVAPGDCGCGKKAKAVR